MSSTPNAINQADAFQARASDPAASAWVSANAGSGKTYVLVNRIIRLLLAGNEPQRILCLTYTKAAAAEMENRLFLRLSAWIELDDTTLQEHISALNAGAFWNGDLNQARQLFTRALETPGGLKIQTIHAFCESVLQRFPIEAKVPPGFSILDERTSSAWLSEVREKVLMEAALAPGSPRGLALSAVSGLAQAAGFDDVLTDLLHQRSPIVAAWSTPDKGDAAKQALQTALGVANTGTEDNIISEAIAELPGGLVDDALAALRSGSTRDLAQAKLLESVKTVPNPVEKWSHILSFFLKSSQKIAKTPDFLMTAKTSNSHPGLREKLIEEQTRIAAIEDKRLSKVTWQASDGLFTLASEILTAFSSEKRRRGQLDYTDLIVCTSALLRNVASAWIMYRLDNGIDHVLIDEAQDTSPQQWEIVNALTEEFFTGNGARADVARTLFAVGDRKQSIYSFQGADPDGFDRQRVDTQRAARHGNARFEPVNLNVSFRSTPLVLEAVDNVFKANPLAASGVAEEGGEWPDHQATRSDFAGLVELWPLTEKQDPGSPDPYAPVDRVPVTHHKILLAQEIAARIASWLDPASGSQVRPGDILILLRSRGIMADALVRALAERHIPVAGADRLVLNAHIAVMDLLALARALALPQDDYSLACVLKSPLVGRDRDHNQDDPPEPLTDDDLLELANPRTGTLWAALEAANAPFNTAKQRLTKWRRMAGQMRPFEFFSHVLGPDHGRRWFHKRLGSEADDPIDEFLRLALEFEAAHAPSLQGFVEWMDADDAQIKREMDQGKNEVRVMTVHGAKGLESNIVILPDTTSVPDARKTNAVLGLGESASGFSIPVWKLKSDLQPQIVADQVQREIATAMEEENRLLYVAMTRARDQLYVCGAGDPDKLREECWYAKVQAMIVAHGSEVFGETATSGTWRIGQPRRAGAHEEIAVEPAPQTLEDWMRQPAPPEPPEPRPLAPSRLDFELVDGSPRAQIKEQPATSPLAGAEGSGFLRGRLIHRLLQSLPDLPVDQRQQAMTRYLNAHAHDFSQTQQDSIAHEVMNLLASSDPGLQALFGPGSIAEAPVTARLPVIGPGGAPIIISGIIDRLAVLEDEILVADFKTNRELPAHVEEIPIAYTRQLAAYGLALQQIYPGRTVRAWLVWTQNAQIMEVPEEMLNSAFT